MKVVIIEDEINVREGFLKMLSVFCPDVEVVGVADSVESGIKVVKNVEFDLLFLDVNLPDGSGFDIVYRLMPIHFKLVFVTAYDKYAVNAFKLSAIDYLLKPVSPDLLIKAVDKVKYSLMHKISQPNVDLLESNLNSPGSQENKIILKDQDGLHLVKIKEIIYCQAEGSYTNFILESSKKIMTSTNLKEYENLLLPYKFLRSHHSFLVNLNHVIALKKVDGGYLETTDSAHLPISTRKKADIINKIKTTFIC